MKFSGHETFHVREGWLHKGLSLVAREPQALSSDEAADLMGVGNNMAKSIRHWLLATGLVAKPEGDSAHYEMTPIGRVVHEYDPFFTSDATWWALHINIATNPAQAGSWNWLFNASGLRRFEKGVAIEQLRRHLRHHTNRKPPSPNTLARDLAVLLSSYSRMIPHDLSDPEDSKYCPFQQLDLISFFRESGFYRINFSEKEIPVQMLGYALVNYALSPDLEEEFISRSVSEIASASGGPCKVFCIRDEALFHLALEAEETLTSEWLSVSGLAGSRMLRFRAFPPEAWLTDYYQKEIEIEEDFRTSVKTQLLEPYEAR